MGGFRQSKLLDGLDRWMDERILTKWREMGIPVEQGYVLFIFFCGRVVMSCVGGYGVFVQ
jgi:hypothetical protein